jgi:hypothetical protein
MLNVPENGGQTEGLIARAAAPRVENRPMKAVAATLNRNMEEIAIIKKVLMRLKLIIENLTVVTVMIKERVVMEK